MVSRFHSLLFSFLLIVLMTQVKAENSKSSSAHDDFLNYSLQQLIETKVTVASLSEEKVSEAPVPVSLITQIMIEQSGALTLKSLLLTYVPGFTDVEDQNEINIASRGIFTSSQQKILILINGHRLNIRSNSMAAPDHSISLDKIKQIEVLRGPASSLYGNVSLTATINIILKSSDDIDNGELSLLIGDHGQQGVSFLAGKKSKDYEIFLWANTYQADGEKIKLAQEDVYSENPTNSNQAIIYGIKDKSPYDIGLTLKNTYGEFFINARRSHYIEPFSAAGLSGEPYNYEKYEKVDGYGVGFGYTANHFEYKNKFTFLDWQNETRIYWDNSAIKGGVIINPSLPLFGAPQWKDSSAGILSTFESQIFKGNFLFGIQIEGYKIYGQNFPIGISSHEISSTVDNMLPSGKESSYSSFIQYKSHLSENWQSNLGFRYDYKNRKTTDNVDQLSPRLSLVYNRSNASVKFSYSQSFVDATYWNRFSNLSSFKGAKNLKPEKLRSLQISPSFTLTNYNVQLTSNFFYDQAIDVIFRDNTATTNNYSNSGELNTWGVEQELTYITPSMTVRFNGTYRRAINSEKIAINEGYINNIPKITGNLVFDKSLTNSVNFHLSLRYIGKQYSPIVIQHDGVKIDDPYPSQGVKFNQPNNVEKHTWLIASNVIINISANLSMNLKVDNLFNKQYNQGGTTLHPYPKKGRWVYLQANYSF